MNEFDVKMYFQFFSKYCLPDEDEDGSPEVRIDLELIEVVCQDEGANPMLGGLNQGPILQKFSAVTDKAGNLSWVVIDPSLVVHINQRKCDQIWQNFAN